MVLNILNAGQNGCHLEVRYIIIDLDHSSRHVEKLRVMCVTHVACAPLACYTKLHPLSNNNLVVPN